MATKEYLEEITRERATQNGSVTRERLRYSTHNQDKGVSVELQREACTLAETRKIVTANTETLASLKARASMLQVEIDTLGTRLADPAAKEAATRAIMKQIGLRDTDLQEINVKIAEVATDANDSTDKLERAVRQAFEEARESLSNVASIKQLHEFFTQHVGPMILTADRKIVPGVSIPSPAPRRSVHHGNPLRDAFWRAFQAA